VLHRRTALDVESIVRQHGAVPATVAVLDGLLCVGVCVVVPIH
jgi:pseudouridine-5'-phosphate glycosidase